MSLDQKDAEFNPTTQIIDGELIADVAGAEFGDPNLDLEHLDDFEDSTPYPEVRSAVVDTGDTEMPCNTFRLVLSSLAGLLGIIWAIVLLGLSQFFYFRYPSVTIGNLVAQLISYLMDRLLAFALPKIRIFGVDLNPGPSPSRSMFWSPSWPPSGHYQPSLLISLQYSARFMAKLGTSATQLIGYSSAGIARRFLVGPSSMIWPANLAYCAFQYTLQPRIRGYCFRWYFFPGYLFTALSYFSWAYWIAPNNMKANQMFSVIHGLEGYKEYSPLFLSTTFALSYNLSFTGIISAVVHTILFFRKQIWVQARQRCPPHEPLWTSFLSLVIAFVYIVPIGMVQAVINQQVGLSASTELIIGYALPGRPIAVMAFKAWGHITKRCSLLQTSCSVIT
ncbi:hypothetical protein FRC10_003442 [Ceratobasidium sp. 414]|nr:hypothetical protein FRC10_003442 [Ceratobasidium sp. 414]